MSGADVLTAFPSSGLWSLDRSRVEAGQNFLMKVQFPNAEQCGWWQHGRSDWPVIVRGQSVGIIGLFLGGNWQDGIAIAMIARALQRLLIRLLC